MGAIAVMVPTEVPIDTEIKQPITNRPVTAIEGGIMESPRFTVLSTPPAALMVPEKAPAARKIRHMVTMFSSPMPLEIMVSLRWKSTFLFWQKAMDRAIRKPTIAGMVLKSPVRIPAPRNIIRNTPIGSSAQGFPFLLLLIVFSLA